MSDNQTTAKQYCDAVMTIMWGDKSLERPANFMKYSFYLGIVAAMKLMLLRTDWNGCPKSVLDEINRLQEEAAKEADQVNPRVKNSNN